MSCHRTTAPRQSTLLMTAISESTIRTSGEPPAGRGVPLCPDSGARVHILHREASGRPIRIHCRRVVTLVGSNEGCKVCLPHPRVSGVHLAIVHDGRNAHGVDLLTPLATTLNGLRLAQEVLDAADRLRIGPWEFEVEVAFPAFPGPIVLDPMPELVTLEHIPSGRRLTPRRDICLIGRRAGCDVTVDDESVSRVHALLLRFEYRPAVCDLLSCNGVWVNEERVSYRVLTPGDVLRVGTVSFRVLTATEQAAPHSDGNGRAAQPSPLFAPLPPRPDLIDIRDVEGAQRWVIADNIKRPRGKTREPTA